ncbi:MAG TPA: flavodoxin-dependent (E)-4-hydroxy-3-methylbut-2-enyl-diphosphate synthase [Spirochaetota bacterium]|nr:flavodoxin-dependent (E)-4-hydroxy-3-methylbut-2-enyl-diphosphate synthase [Spirochaetota bacterium]HPJ33744.1 flavodoxin-dependent (E)-4-hydroxy-3-methylbut-2-enyl-diphosphate synthase [Spirochaetota bacterium]
MSEHITRRESKKIRAGSLSIGGDAPVSVQSMTNIHIEDTERTIAQINRLESLGADIVRLAVRNEKGIGPLKEIIKSVNIPLVADIHFDYRLAVEAIKAGISKVRINPGNIGENWKVEEVIKAARDRNIPIRVGVNGGSINRKKYTHPTPDALVDSALENIRILEDHNYTNIVVSIKSSDIFSTIEANTIMSETRDYPIHIGLTEAGYGLNCTVQSSIVLGHLLLKGIGDTIRVSMTGDPGEEILVGRKILESLGLKYSPVKIISCPTCGRTASDIDLLKIAQQVDSEIHSRFEKKLSEGNKKLTIAVMGCEVNGPGEASEADFGLAGGQNGKMLLFAKGERLKTVSIDAAVDTLIKIVSDSI